jgi:hypothetical protein
MHKNVAFSVYVLVFLLGILISLPFTAFGQASDNSTIDVTIQSIAEITVSPDSLAFSVAPCDHTNTQLLDITNTGSLNVSRLESYVDTIENESTNPYGLDDNTLYAATSLLTVRNETNSDIFFAGRLEWNYTQAISNGVLSGVSSCTNPGLSGNCSWGFIKNTSIEYMWAAGNGTGGYCNDSSAQIAIEDDADDGSAGTRTPTIASITYEDADPYFAYFRIDRATQPLLFDTCVALSWNCSKIYLYKFDKRTTPYNMGSCANAAYVQYDNLVPGVTHTMTINAYAPCGIPDGALKQGNIYIVAQSGL